MGQGKVLRYFFTTGTVSGIEPHNLNIQLKLNGQIKQMSNTSNLIFFYTAVSSIYFSGNAFTAGRCYSDRDSGRG